MQRYLKNGKLSSTSTHFHRVSLNIISPCAIAQTLTIGNNSERCPIQSQKDTIQPAEVNSKGLTCVPIGPSRRAVSPDGKVIGSEGSAKQGSLFSRLNMMGKKLLA